VLLAETTSESVYLQWFHVTREDNFAFFNLYSLSKGSLIGFIGDEPSSQTC